MKRARFKMARIIEEKVNLSSARLVQRESAQNNFIGDFALNMSCYSSFANFDRLWLIEAYDCTVFCFLIFFSQRECESTICCLGVSEWLYEMVAFRSFRF